MDGTSRLMGSVEEDSARKGTMLLSAIAAAVVVVDGRSRGMELPRSSKFVTRQGGGLWRTKVGTRERGDAMAPLLGRPT
jgi:hypothetical protein